MAYTPGPWKTGEKKYLPQEIRGGGHRIAQAMYWSGSENAGEVEANAHLIAAAPSLLKGLERAEQTIRNLAANLDGDLAQIARNEAVNIRDDIAQAKEK